MHRTRATGKTHTVLQRLRFIERNVGLASWKATLLSKASLPRAFRETKLVCLTNIRLLDFRLDQTLANITIIMIRINVTRAFREMLRTLVVGSAGIHSRCQTLQFDVGDRWCCNLLTAPMPRISGQPYSGGRHLPARCTSATVPYRSVPIAESQNITPFDTWN